MLHRARTLGLTDADLDTMRMDEFLTLCEVHLALARASAPKPEGQGKAPAKGREMTLEEFAAM